MYFNFAGIKIGHPGVDLAGDAQREAAKANPFYDFLANTGRGLASGAADVLPGYANGNVSAADTPSWANEFAGYSGISPNGTPAGDPYQLLPYQQQVLNQQQDNITQMHKGSMGRLTAELTAQGKKPGDPGWEAAMQHLNDFHQGQLTTHNAEFMNTAQQQHQQAAQTLAQMMAQYGQNRFSNENALLGEGNQMIGQGTAGYRSNAGQDMALNQERQQQDQSNQNFWQGLIGGGARVAMGQPPGGGAGSPSVTPSYGGGASAPYNANPMYDEAGTGQAAPAYSFGNGATPLTQNYNLSNPFAGATGFGGFNPNSGLSLNNASMFKQKPLYGAPGGS